MNILLSSDIKNKQIKKESFEELNASLKGLITKYQLDESIDMAKLDLLHKNLLSLFFKKLQFEDLVLKIQRAYLEIKKGRFDYLVKDQHSYHTLLWKLHQRYLILQKPVKFDEDTTQFKRYFGKNKVYFIKGELFNSIHTTIGKAKGHYIVITFNKNELEIELSDHYLPRMLIFIERMGKFGLTSFGPESLPLFTKKDGTENYYAVLKGKRFTEDMKIIAKELKDQINTDWICYKQGANYNSPNKLLVEYKALELAYVMKDYFGVPLIKTINNLYGLSRWRKKQS